jgi:hypothetical protein
MSSNSNNPPGGSPGGWGGAGSPGFGPTGGGYGGYGGSGSGDWTRGGFAAQPPPPGMPPGHVPSTSGTAPLTEGLPWESRQGGLFSRWWATVKVANFETRPFFAAAVQYNSGGVPACTFNMMSGAISGFVFGLIYLVLFTVLGAAGVLSSLRGPAPGLASASAGFGVGIGLFYLVVMTVGQAMGGFINPWIVGGIHHLVLMLFGGAHRNYEHTVRGFGYAMGAAMAWGLIPALGVFPMLVFSWKNIVQAYDEIHQCGVGKAVLAMLAPVLVCCGCYALFVALFVAMAGAMRGP